MRHNDNPNIKPSLELTFLNPKASAQVQNGVFAISLQVAVAIPDALKAASATNVLTTLAQNALDGIARAAAHFAVIDKLYDERASIALTSGWLDPASVATVYAHLASVEADREVRAQRARDAGLPADLPPELAAALMAMVDGAEESESNPDNDNTEDDGGLRVA